MLAPWCDWCGEPACSWCNPPAKSDEQIAADVHALLNSTPITFTREQLVAFGEELDGLADAGARMAATAARHLDRIVLDAIIGPDPIIVRPPIPPEPFMPRWALAFYSTPARRPYLHGIMALGLDAPTVVLVEGRAVGKSEELRCELLTLDARRDELLAKAVEAIALVPPPESPPPAKLKPRAPVPLPAKVLPPRGPQIPIRYTGIRRKGSRNA